MQRASQTEYDDRNPPERNKILALVHKLETNGTLESETSKQCQWLLWNFRRNCCGHPAMHYISHNMLFGPVEVKMVMRENIELLLLLLWREKSQANSNNGLQFGETIWPWFIEIHNIQRTSGPSSNKKTDCKGTGKMVEELAATLPDNVLEVIFSYLDLHDLRNCSLVCTNWYRFLNDENNDVWRLHCIRKLAEEALKSDLLSSVPTYKAKLRAFYHAWNPNDCSRNVYIKPNGFTLHRNPVAQSTDAARGKIGFRHGRHAWEVIWEGALGTVAVIGIATKEAPLQCHGYVALLGSDDQSWGWNLVDNHLLHNGDSQGNYPLLNNAPKYQVGERIRVILDCDDNTLSFEKNYEFLGVAFRDVGVAEERRQGLPDKRLYPSVSAVYGNTEVSMVYLGPPLDG
uniref:F-box/SPRY domain-containing protein 1 n=1 Tax=Timema poppense TaxID=170557 RepID=A0A7R9GX38_TIMPO|nr:unnamed protein product [Timema poppensis]